MHTIRLPRVRKYSALPVERQSVWRRRRPNRDDWDGWISGRKVDQQRRKLTPPDHTPTPARGEARISLHPGLLLSTEQLLVSPGAMGALPVLSTIEIVATRLDKKAKHSSVKSRAPLIRTRRHRVQPSRPLEVAEVQGKGQTQTLLAGLTGFTLASLQSGSALAAANAVTAVTEPGVDLSWQGLLQLAVDNPWVTLGVCGALAWAIPQLLEKFLLPIVIIALFAVVRECTEPFPEKNRIKFLRDVTGFCFGDSRPCFHPGDFCAGNIPPGDVDRSFHVPCAQLSTPCRVRSERKQR